MSVATADRRPKRERLRSRFHVGLLLAGGLLLGACSQHFGLGLAELPAASGWQPLPVGAWVLNDDLAVEAMSFCPQASCARPGFAAVFSIAGTRGVETERALSADPASLRRAFAPKPDKTKRKGSEPRQASTITVARLDSDGAQGLLVSQTGANGKQANTAILYRREGDALTVALAVAEDRAKAERDAAAAWRSR